MNISKRIGICLFVLALGALAWVAAPAAAETMCLRAGNTTRTALAFGEDGLYKFCGCSGTPVTGIGTVTRDGDTITIEHNGPDRLRASVDTAANSGTASLQTPVSSGSCDVDDSNVADGTCACDLSCVLSCPEDMRVPGKAKKGGARVSYPAPAPTDEKACGEVTCNVASGSLFAQGTTVVRCAADKRAVCNFRVTVN